MLKRTLKISAVVTLFLGMSAPFAAMATGTVLISTPTASAQLMVTNYSRHEDWTYTCSLLSNAARAVNYYLSAAASQVAGVFGLSAPLAETTSSLCPGNGGIGAVSTDLTWDYKKGGFLISKETTAPRYGSNTCTTITVWPAEDTWPTRKYPTLVSDSCTGTKLVCDWNQYYKDFMTTGVSSESPNTLDCGEIWLAYGPISDGEYMTDRHRQVIQYRNLK